MASTVLEQLNSEMASVVDDVRRGLVQVQGYGHGAGAGTIWHPEGMVLTNAHVVRQSPFAVTLPGGRNVAAKLLARDKETDVAALQLEGNEQWPVVTVGDSHALRSGQWVMALGHPWGVRNAATAGVVLGAGPKWPSIHGRRGEYIAVSLPLRPGNSGGPLVDAAGAVVGINTMMIGPETGLSVPVHVVKDFLKSNGLSFF
jgi:S1-C subfamily serine protease